MPCLGISGGVEPGNRNLKRDLLHDLLQDVQAVVLAISARGHRGILVTDHVSDLVDRDILLFEVVDKGMAE